MSPVDESEVETFHVLMQRVREGDQEAAWTLLETYGRFVLHVVRQHLSPQLRSKFDSMDFVQNVWASFFREPEAIRDFSHPKDLVNYLRAMARNKLGMEARRRLQTAKYDIGREASLVSGESEKSPEVESDRQDTRQPTPSQIAMAREQWQRWLARQTPCHREVVRMRFSGASYEEIAQSLNINERTARRVVERLMLTID